MADAPLYRYILSRNLDATLVASDSAAYLAWVMLNPSIATEDIDDPTIRRVISFTKAACYGALRVVNLFPMRGTDPVDLTGQSLSVLGYAHECQESQIFRTFEKADRIVCAWGSSVKKVDRVHRMAARQTMFEAIEEAGHKEISYLGLTQDRHPCHPLRLSRNTELQTMLTVEAKVLMGKA